MQPMETSLMMMMPRMDEEEDEDIGSMSSFSEHEDSSNSVGSSASSSDITEDASSSNSSLSSSFQPPMANDQLNQGPLFEMSDLISDLPIKRGLSNFFQGRSQSFASLSNARSVEDLVKPEKPYIKRMKSCRSYAGNLDRHKSLSPKHNTKGAIMKKASSNKGSFGSLGMKKRSFSGLKSAMPPPIPRSGSLLFA